MATIKVKFSLNIGLVGCRKEEIVEVEDDMTDDELDEYWSDWRNEKCDGGWKRL